MKKFIKAVLATLVFVVFMFVSLQVVGQISADSEAGSLIRTALGGLLAGLTLVWGGYLLNLMRSGRNGKG